jgi:hypothetical protein
MNVEGVFTMEVSLRKEHEDGSATYTFDMNDSERHALLRLGIITALERGIEEAKKYRDDEEYQEDVETDSSLPSTSV